MSFESLFLFSAILLLVFLNRKALKENSSLNPKKEIQKKQEYKSNFQNEKKVFFTKNGEQVRSRFEKEIADFLREQKIRYEYEKPVFFEKKEIHPDFYLSDHDVFIEYFGMLGNPKYNHIIHLKRDTYEKMGIKVIYLYPNNFRNFGWIIKKRFEKTTKRTFPQRKYIQYNPL